MRVYARKRADKGDKLSGSLAKTRLKCGAKEMRRGKNSETKGPEEHEVEKESVITK